MPYISNLERESLAAGEARGRVVGKTELVIQLLNRRTGKVSKEILAKIEALPIAPLAPKAIEQLEKLGEDLLDFTSSKDLADWLQNYGDNTAAGVGKSVRK